MMHLQTKPNMTEPTSDLADAWASLKKPTVRPPPGLSLEPEDNEPAAPAAKPGAMKLSLADLCGDAAKKSASKIRPPPGFDDILNGEVISLRFDGEEVSFDTGGEQVVDAPPGLPSPMKMKKGFNFKGDGLESEETSAGSDSERSDSYSNKGMSISLDAMLTDVSTLKASAPLFTPKLSAETAAMLPAVPQPTQGTPLKTSLRSLKTAAAYVPSPTSLPFVPMSAVENAWENWHMQNSDSPHSWQAEYANDSSAEWENDYGYSADYYPEAEWTY